MTERYQTVGAIRRACNDISDHWEGSLSGPRVTGSIGGSAGSKEPPTPVGVDVLDARRDAHGDLAHWARVVLELVVDGEGRRMTWTLPDDDTQPLALAAFVSHWAERLADIDQAEAELCAEELAKHGHKLKALALPDRRDWMPIGDCPVTVADADGNSVECGATVRAYDRVAESTAWTSEADGAGRKIERIQFIRCPGCGTEDTLAWWMSQIIPEGSDRATASEVIAYVAMCAGLILHHDQIRKWASLGNIQRHGKDVKGRTLYSSAAVLAYARRQEKEAVA